VRRGAHDDRHGESRRQGGDDHRRTAGVEVGWEVRRLVATRRAVVKATVVCASNRAAAGVYEDTAGPLIADALREAGFEGDGPVLVPDGPPVGDAIRSAIAAGARVVITTGGTGLTPTDRTPEETRQLLDREVPGIAEAIRTNGVAKGV